MCPAMSGCQLSDFYTLAVTFAPRRLMDYIPTRITPCHDKKVAVYDGKSRISAEDRVQSIRQRGG
jgi:hypothetical protein